MFIHSRYSQSLKVYLSVPYYSAFGNFFLPVLATAQAYIFLVFLAKVSFGGSNPAFDNGNQASLLQYMLRIAAKRYTEQTPSRASFTGDKQASGSAFID